MRSVRLTITTRALETIAAHSKTMAALILMEIDLPKQLLLLLILNLREFQNFAILSVFSWNSGQNLRMSWISSHAYQWAFSTGFPMSSLGGVQIFSGIAHSFCL